MTSYKALNLAIFSHNGFLILQEEVKNKMSFNFNFKNFFSLITTKVCQFCNY